MHESSPAAEIARSPAAWERIAKDWLVELIERSPIADAPSLPLTWMAHEAPPLIAEILGQLSDPGSARNLELPAATRNRASALAHERSGSRTVGGLPRDLAALQGVLIEALGRESRSSDRSEFTRAVGRLAEVFGAVQETVLDAVGSPNQVNQRAEVELEAEPEPEPAPPSAPDPPPPPQFDADRDARDELLSVLDSHIERYAADGTALSIAHVEVEGFKRIASGYGRPGADGMMSAVAAIIAGQLEPGQRSYRIRDDGFVVVAPEDGPQALGSTIMQAAEIVDESQADKGPRVAIAAGIATLQHAEATAESLMEAAEEAAWAAQSEGRAWSLAGQGLVQDL